MDLAALIRTVPDFPKPGIQFKDITTLLQNGDAFKTIIESWRDRYAARGLNAVVGAEARGFIFGAAVAKQLGIGFVPIRKPGKLPAETISESYELEYGTNTVEIHKDALRPAARVVIIDDLLATGGTVAASIALVEKLGAEVAEAAFVVELSFLNGRAKLGDTPVYAQVAFDGGE